MVYLGIGTNLGNRRENLQTAIQAFHVLKKSSMYETEPVGFLEQPWFFNAVIEIETAQQPHQLLEFCQSIENQMGRIRKIPKGPRTIDVDVLFYNGLIIQDADLTIPHPEIPNRRFVLEPMAEIAPDFIHPAMKISIAELLKQCPDRSVVRKIAGT